MNIYRLPNGTLCRPISLGDGAADECTMCELKKQCLFIPTSLCNAVVDGLKVVNSDDIKTSGKKKFLKLPDAEFKDARNDKEYRPACADCHADIRGSIFDCMIEDPRCNTNECTYREINIIQL